VQLKGYKKVLIENIIKEVTAELSYTFKQNANSVLASETYAENAIKLRQLLNGIESGQVTINFQEIEFKKVITSLKQKLIIALSCFRWID